MQSKEFGAIAQRISAISAIVQSSSGLILENERIEWDYAEAGLYRLIQESLML